MKNFTRLFIYALLLLAYTGTFAQSGPPKTRVQTITDSYFGIKVSDDYRWLEAVDEPEVKDWFKAQGDYCNSMLNRIPGRDSLIATFAAYDRMQPSSYVGVMRRYGRYFFRKTIPGENVSKLYYKVGQDGRENLIVDPEKYEGGKGYYITSHLPSDDGKKLAIAFAKGGGEISTVKFYDIAGKKFLIDSLSLVWDAFSWSPDGKGIIYTLMNSADPFDTNFQMNTVAKYHVLGTAQSADRVLLSGKSQPDFGISKVEIPKVYFSNDHKFLIGNLTTVDSRMHVLIAPATDLSKDNISWRLLLKREDSIAHLVDVGGRLFLHSVKGAPNGKILATSWDQPNIATAEVVVPEGHKIYGIHSNKEFLLITKEDVVRSYLQTYEAKSGHLKDIQPPVNGIYYFYGYDPEANDCTVIAITWLQPTVVYNFEARQNRFTKSQFSLPAKYPGLADMTVDEIEIPGHDGVMIPLSILYRKGMKKDGSSVCFMTGYGAYGYSATPYFDPNYLALLNKGVIIAITHPRGGSEKGLSWYMAGFKTTKPNTWKDFISSGEYLVKNGYTSASHLIGEGTSAGGILIGRAITERPDLFAAAINNVGATNVFRFELTPNSDNVAEFGTFKDSVESKALYEMDALYHVKSGTKYPAVINVGGMNDPRVIIWQPGKFAAALQNASSSGKPVLMQVNYDNGHFTEDKTVMYRDFANMYAFALWQAGHPSFQLKK